MTMELVNDHQPCPKRIPGHREPAGHSASEISSRPTGFTDHPDTLPPNVNEPPRCGSDDATVRAEPAGSVANADKDKDKDKGREQEEQRRNEVEEEDEEEEEGEEEEDEEQICPQPQ